MMKFYQLPAACLLSLAGVDALGAPVCFYKEHTNRLGSIVKASSRESNENTEIRDDNEEPVMRTIGGGEGLIFEMARRMAVWNKDKSENGEVRKSSPVLPRWHPHGGISDVNPSFRTKPPIMNNRGYAGIIWRNVRKRNKPSLWRHSLRTYDRMKAMEESRSQEISVLKIQRSNIHFEGALLACAKLATWEKALEIYEDVIIQEKKTANQNGAEQTKVTENMILSLIKACVMGCKAMDRRETSVSERRVSLDSARDILLKLEERHGLPLAAVHLNPLAAAYQSLGLMRDAKDLLKKNLNDRASGPEAENGDDPFNVLDLKAKDKASYSLLVKGAVSEGDWCEAVEALRDMTEAGSYPSERNLNSWVEVSERKTRQRNTRSRKKKRDEYWLDSIT